MTSINRKAAWRSIATGTVLLVGAAATLPAIAQEDFVTEVPELGGFSAKAVSSPLSLELYEPVVPVPAGPGEPHGEMHASYSRATLGTGPTGRGLGSSTWPGSTAGDGLSAFDPNIPPYPFKASATYPDGPFEDNERGDTNSNTGMFAHARGIDIYGESNGGGDLYPGVVSVGNSKTVSTTNVVDGVVIAETIATLDDVSFIEGLITIDSFQTRLVARSNGEVAETEGTYEFSGLEIMGQGYEMTDDGIVATGPEGEPITIPLGTGNSIDFADAVGIKVDSTPVVEEIDGASGRRSTRGVLITIDTSPLRDAVGFLPLAEVIGMIPDDQTPDVVPCDQAPDQLGFVPCFSDPLTGAKANLFTLAALQPEFRILMGGAEVSTTASLPFEFSPPPLPPLPAAPPPSSGSVSTVTTPSFTAPPPAAAPAPEAAPVVAPASSGGSATPQFVALSVPEDLSGGVGAGLFLLSIAGVGLIARGGRKLTMAAMYGATAPAAVGAAAVPDLRAFARGENV